MVVLHVRHKLDVKQIEDGKITVISGDVCEDASGGDKTSNVRELHVPPTARRFVVFESDMSKSK